MAFSVKHPDAVHAFFVGDGLHDLVGDPAIVIEHELPCGAGDAAEELIGAQLHRLYQLPLLRAEVGIAAHCADRDDKNRQGKDQLGAKFSRH